MTYPRELIDPIIAKNNEFDLEGFVFGNGDFSPEIMLIGEAPGEVEIRTGVPFTGRAGKELDKTLAIAGLTRDQVYITSVVRSRPFGHKTKIDRAGHTVQKYPNRLPKPQEILLHAPLLDYEISQVKPKLIVALGGCALKRLIDNKMTISASHGRLWRGPIKQLGADGKYEASPQDYTIFPTFHPAAIFYNRKIESDLIADWEQLKEILASKSY
ncbi:uracil-DNA glycosylase [Listeria booriae]|uniref:Uracil-DNA glycosylase n=1 Tax=Listeria booriae TaxID=1552123 RepID=A0A7X0TMU4_9LIST|nr:uracil-DNA glycosylase [Listeria booriae]MBC1210382.1 uracil-DNA glycosylase [Listeria booriae]MBC1287264.1 uracil-DNA glycosylase [Listeria booriae]MBC1317124.1 uracil-DNA glycosylase [Listeria booriae]MBC1332018.1 uracil-DNA glycosylase [Listeria booriae]MBC1801259.1 uracil-DNA glycosylase [Listeria booriae]